MRLDKILADQGFGTRKEVRKLIKSGAVHVGDQVLDDPAYHPSSAEVELITVGDELLTPYPHHYLLLNKPVGVLTALKGNRYPLVADYLPPKLVERGLTPVGRLDLDSSGLLLCTDDGQLNHRLTSPKWGIPKRYYVELHPGHPPIDDAMVEKFTEGIMLSDGLTKPAELEPIDNFASFVTLREGRNRQVRRMFEKLGQEVTKLHRIAFGPLEEYEDMEPGALYALEADEVEALYKLCELSSPRLF